MGHRGKRWSVPSIARDLSWVRIDIPVEFININYVQKTKQILLYVYSRIDFSSCYKFLRLCIFLLSQHLVHNARQKEKAKISEEPAKNRRFSGKRKSVRNLVWKNITMIWPLFYNYILAKRCPF